MKKLIIIICFFLIVNQNFAQSFTTYGDTAHYLMNEIEGKKSLYIGKPVSVLLDSLKIQPVFSINGDFNKRSFGSHICLYFNYERDFYKAHILIVSLQQVPSYEMYLLSITDKDKYSKFLGTKDKYYDKDSRSGWKLRSKIERSYSSFIIDFMQRNPGVDPVFPTQLYLINEYNMGVSFQRWNSNVNGFEVLKTHAKYNTSTGSSSTLTGGGSAINSPYEEIKVEVSCQ